MRNLTFKVYNNLITLEWIKYADSCTLGHTHDDEKWLGFGQYTIPAKYREPFLNWHNKNDGSVLHKDEWEGGDLETNTADTYVHFCIG